MRLYQSAAQHELAIAGDNVGLFAERIGFADRDKALRLRCLLTSYRRKPNRERFIADVESIEADGVEAVYDVQIPGINAFDANGLLRPQLRRTAVAALRRLPAGFDQSRRAGEGSVHARRARSTWRRWNGCVPVAVRMLDNVGRRVALSAGERRRRRPRPSAASGSASPGLADALIFCGVRYGSPEAVRLTRDWLGAVQRFSYLASADIAAEKGSFRTLRSRRAISPARRSAACPRMCAPPSARYGIRNALLNSIAPTGTISLLADNVSSGIEPVFAFGYVRHVLQPDGTQARGERRGLRLAGSGAS